MAFDFKESFQNNLYNEGKSAIGRLTNLDDIIDTTYQKEDRIRNNFKTSNTSYSGTDCLVIVQANDKLLLLGNLETFSYSIFREKSPIRVLGKSYPKGYTSGGRTIAGSMVFVVFDRHPLYDVIKEMNYVRDQIDRYTSPVADQLPPLDLILVFNNEYGHTSLMRLFAVEFVQEGQVMSVNDLYTENTMQYVARDMDIMIDYDNLQEFKDMLFERQSKGLFVDGYLGSMIEYKNKVSRQIEEVNQRIAQIDMETNRRAVAGVVTLGLSSGLNWLVGQLPGVETVTREQLNKEKQKQLDIKKSLMTELDNVNNQVQQHERTMTGWNAQNSGNGIASTDNLKQQTVL